MIINYIGTKTVTATFFIENLFIKIIDSCSGTVFDRPKLFWDILFIYYLYCSVYDYSYTIRIWS